jgi:hypothetical protein
MNGPHDELYEFHPYHNVRAKKQCRFAKAPRKSQTRWIAEIRRGRFDRGARWERS